MSRRPFSWDFILLFHFLLQMSAAAPHCQFLYDTAYGGTVMDCDNLQLTEIPRVIPWNVTTLTLRNNLLTVIKNNTFVSAVSLRSLVLSHNRIKKLQENAFTGIRNLTKLSLAFNRLNYTYDSFPEEVFLPLRSLESLILNDNRVEEPNPYPDLAFRHLVNLRELRVDTFHNVTLGKGFTELTKLEVLDFSGDNCLLSKIENDTFYYLQNSSLIVLNLESCPLHGVEIAAFSPLRHLSVLNMKWCKYLPIADAMTTLYGLQGINMSDIDFTNVFSPQVYPYKDYGKKSLLTEDTTKYLVTICVKKLYLQNDVIFYMDMHALSKPPFASCIEELYISGNVLHGDYLYYLNLAMFTRLKRLDISNQIPATHDFTISSSLVLNALTYVFYFPPQLEYFNIGGLISSMGHFPDVKVKNGEHLTYFNFSFNGVKGFNGHLTGLPNVKTLDISRNNAAHFVVDFLYSFPKLVTLWMNSMYFDIQFFNNNAKRMFSNCTELESISLAHNNLPAIPPDIFNYLLNLKFVDLSHNKLVSLTIVTSITPSLQALDISYNSVIVVSPDDLQIIDSNLEEKNISIALTGNPIACTCNNLAFITWLFTSTSIFDKGGNYMCRGNDGNITTTSEFFRNSYVHWVACIGPALLTATIVLFCLIIICLLCAFILLNNWTMIQHTLLRLLGGPYRRPRRCDFPFACYIGNCDNDYEFVYTTVYETLEIQGRLPLFLEEREVIPGHSITEGIIDGINTSWKTLLIITREFLEDRWSFLKIKTCVYAVSSATPRRIILLIIGDVRAPGIPPDILTVVQEEDIFCIPNNDSADEALSHIKELIATEQYD